MKKILFMLPIMVTLLLFTSCSKDEGSESQTFFVNVYTQAESIYDDGNTEKKLVEDANVYLFKSDGGEIDTQKSAESIANSSVLTYTDGTTSKQAEYKITNNPGVFNFENISNGQYVLWVEYNFGYGVTYHSSKAINVNNDYRGKTEEKVFITSISDKGFYRYQNW